MRGVCRGVSILVALGVLVVKAAVAFAQAPPPAYPAPHDAYPPPAYPPQPYPPPAYPAYPPPGNPYQLPPPTFGPVGPVVHLRADNPKAQLQQLQLRWRTICVAPCGRPADPAGYYRIGGDTIRPSAPFRLPRPSGEVLIDTHVGSNVRHFVGLGIGIGGIVAAAYGTVVLSLGQAVNDNTQTGMDASHFFYAYGIAFIVVGAVLGAVGISLWNTSTSVEVH